MSCLRLDNVFQMSFFNMRCHSCGSQVYKPVQNTAGHVVTSKFSLLPLPFKRINVRNISESFDFLFYNTAYGRKFVL